MNPAPSALRAVQVALHDHVCGCASAIVDDVAAGGHITIERRLQIYHHAYRARLQEAMQDSFEKTWAYLGDAEFAAAASAYVEGHPPAHRNLRWYGAGFVPWLAQRFPADADIGELAMIDWQLRNAFDGVDARPIAPAALQQLTAGDWQNLGCRFAPTLWVAPLRFNSVSIWHALDRDETPPAAAPLNEPTWLLVWRKGWQPHFRTIAAFEHAALAQLRAGRSLAEVCMEGGAEFAGDEAASAVADHLRTWLADEQIVELTGIATRGAGVGAMPPGR